MEAELKAVAVELGYRLFAWSVTGGLVDTEEGGMRPALDPLAAIECCAELQGNSLVLLRDFHAFLEDANPVLVRAVKEELAQCKTHDPKQVVFVAHGLQWTTARWPAPDHLMITRPARDSVLHFEPEETTSPGSIKRMCMPGPPA